MKPLLIDTSNLYEALPKNSGRAHAGRRCYGCRQADSETGDLTVQHDVRCPVGILERAFLVYEGYDPDEEGSTWLACPADTTKAAETVAANIAADPQWKRTLPLPNEIGFGLRIPTPALPPSWTEETRRELTKRLEALREQRQKAILGEARARRSAKLRDALDALEHLRPDLNEPAYDRRRKAILSEYGDVAADLGEAPPAVDF